MMALLESSNTRNSNSLVRPWPQHKIRRPVSVQTRRQAFSDCSRLWSELARLHKVRQLIYFYNRVQLSAMRALLSETLCAATKSSRQLRPQTFLTSRSKIEAINRVKGASCYHENLVTLLKARKSA